MIRRMLGVALVGLAAASIYMSWGALYEFAIATGMPPERAIVFPAVIDVVTVVAMLVALLVEAPSRSVAAYPWIALVIFGAATIAGNAMHVVTAPAGSIRVELWIAVVANALPAVALLITTHLAAVTVYRRAPRRSAWLDIALSDEKFEQTDIDRAVEAHRVDVAHLADATQTPPAYRSDDEMTAREHEEWRRQRVLALRADNLSFAAIADKTGIPKSTVARWCRPADQAAVLVDEGVIA